MSNNRNVLQQLSQITTVVADTGDLNAIAKFKPTDATTNPSLITAAANDPDNLPLIQEALLQAKSEGLVGQALVERAIDLLTVQLGVKILSLIAGRVSTEVDASLSFDTARTVSKAKELMRLYQQAGIAKERVLIKIASTWQGIQAAKQLEKEGIHCNLTLLFGLHQAAACADAGVTLISPFVGRILDWYKKHDGIANYPIEQDPGVLSVKQIYRYYKQHGYNTQIMGASFRSSAQIIALAGCDLLTIAPSLLDELSNQTFPLTEALSPNVLGEPIVKLTLDENSFNHQHQSNPMALDLLQTGIDGFINARIALAEKLEKCHHQC